MICRNDSSERKKGKKKILSHSFVSSSSISRRQYNNKMLKHKCVTNVSNSPFSFSFSFASLQCRISFFFPSFLLKLLPFENLPRRDKYAAASPSHTHTLFLFPENWIIRFILFSFFFTLHTQTRIRG